jgi:hypothetical protein
MASNDSFIGTPGYSGQLLNTSGWVCVKCGRCHAPFVSTCPYCLPYYTTYYTMRGFTDPSPEGTWKVTVLEHDESVSCTLACCTKCNKNRMP